MTDAPTPLIPRTPKPQEALADFALTLRENINISPLARTHVIATAAVLDTVEADHMGSYFMIPTAVLDGLFVENREERHAAQRELIIFVGTTERRRRNDNPEPEPEPQPDADADD